MAWTESKIFTAFVTESFKETTQYDLDTDAIKCALYNNTITPDQTVALANTAYNVGQWVTAQEVYDASEWTQTGMAVTGGALSNPSGNIVMWDASDVESGSSATLDCYGCLVYDDTLAGNYGVTYNWFGGEAKVTDGKLTVVWHANGILRITL